MSIKVKEMLHQEQSKFQVCFDHSRYVVRD